MLRISPLHPDDAPVEARTVLKDFFMTRNDDFRPESDVDVLVEFEPEAHIGFMALSRLQRELAALLQRPVDVVSQDGLKPLIREPVLSSAEVLYAA